MKKYLSELPTKSPAHKKRFALLASGSFTGAIFIVWALVNFGPEDVVVQDTTGPVNLAAAIEATPFEMVLDNIKDSWKALLNRTNGDE